MCNTEIRSEIKRNDVKQWQIADELGIHFTTFTCWLRKELPIDKKIKVMQAIEKIKKGEVDSHVANEITERSV
jgi:hypothetical protein